MYELVNLAKSLDLSFSTCVKKNSWLDDYFGLFLQEGKSCEHEGSRQCSSALPRPVYFLVSLISLIMMLVWSLFQAHLSLTPEKYLFSWLLTLSPALLKSSRKKNELVEMDL